MTKRALAAFGLFVAPAAGVSVSNITKCQEGAASIAGSEKVVMIQVCNLFDQGSYCYMNHVELASSDCATQALKIQYEQCAMFPIKTYLNNDRSTEANLEVGATGCSVSCSNGDCAFSGGCVSVQCEVGVDTIASYAGLGKATTTTGVTDTTNETWIPMDFGGITSSADNIKTVFLHNRGGHIGVYSSGGSSSGGSNDYHWGTLPSLGDSYNYGPMACPSATTLASATSLTQDQIAVCGATAEWSYFGFVNLWKDSAVDIKISGSSSLGLSGTYSTIGNAPYLSGASVYYSGENMDDARTFEVGSWHSDSITPSASAAITVPSGIAGAYRTYVVVMWCKDPTGVRTDLTMCADGNEGVMYVADPNPVAAFGLSAVDIGMASSSGVASGARISASLGAASLGAATVLVIMGLARLS